MTTRKNQSPDFRAKVALEAVREEMTLAELSKKYGVHPNMINSWTRAAIANMAQAFERGKSDEARAPGPRSKSCNAGLRRYSDHDRWIHEPKQPTAVMG